MAEGAAPTASGTGTPPPALAPSDPKIASVRRVLSPLGGASPPLYRWRPERGQPDPAPAFYT